MLAFETSDKPKIVRIYQTQCAKLYRYSFSVLHDEADAADVVQQSILEFLEIFHRLPPMSDDKLRGYLFAITRNNVYDICAKRNKTISLDDQFADAQAQENVEEIVLGNISAQTIRYCIEKLPPRYAAYIKLTYLDALDKDIVAAFLKVKPNSLRMMDVRAKRYLKELCRKELEVIPDA